MSTPIAWNLGLELKAGKADDFRSLVQAQLESTEAEPGTLLYECFINDDGTEAQMYERYADSAAALAHLATFYERFMERMMQCADQVGFDVYGEPDQAVKDALSPANPRYFQTLGGVAH
jgi:quinol monooxygenase YgiN